MVWLLLEEDAANFRLHASMSSVMCPPENESANTGGGTRRFFSVSMAWSSSLLSGKMFLAGFFPSLIQRKRDSRKIGYKLSKDVA